MRRALSILVLLLIAEAPSMVRGAGWEDASKAVAVGHQAQAVSASLPTVDQVLDKYVQAIGGRDALDKVTTRVMKGSIELPGHNGGANWGSSAINPARGMFFVVSKELPTFLAIWLPLWYCIG